MTFDLLDRRSSHFVLWQSSAAADPPRLVLGTLKQGNPCSFSLLMSKELLPGAHPGLWELEAASLGLPDGVYHYWFEVTDTSPEKKGRVQCTDPITYTVDYRIMAPTGYEPAAVIAVSGGKLQPCDPAGERTAIGEPPPLAALAPNTNIVIYELPTSWSRTGTEGTDQNERDVGTFSDVIALLDKNHPGGNFSDLPEVSNRALLAELGVNALELLPPADTKARREWGYATAHYFAPDYDLGFPEGNLSPTATRDLVTLVQQCHSRGIRFFVDVVMAFGHDQYGQIDFDSFHIDPGKELQNPDSYQSNRNNELRAGFGGKSWRYIKSATGYDPQSGTAANYSPAWQFHLAAVTRWMNDFHVDGIRIDSVNNVANWNFLKEYKDTARAHFAARYPGSPASEVDARFLVVGEELNVPLDLLKETVDALWNEHFQSRVRAAIIGESVPGENFELTVKQMVDCRYLGFSDGSKSIIYHGNHDTEGRRKERLYNFLDSCHIYEKEQRAKLAYACLLTSVGIPLILAGDEFCDQQDRPAVHPTKQIDPVNYSRLRDPWRTRVFEYVTNLIGLRKRSPALGVNDTKFIHLDFDDGRRIMAWVRGDAGRHDPVVVVANFSERYTPGPEYVVHDWPATPAGKRWREVTQQRLVPPEWVGREPLYPWEAKVYELVPQ